jgi:hypothetical protein
MSKPARERSPSPKRKHRSALAQIRSDQLSARNDTSRIGGGGEADEFRQTEYFRKRLLFINVPIEESVAVFGCGIEWAVFVPFGVSLRVANWRVKQLRGWKEGTAKLPHLSSQGFRVSR